MIQTTQGGPLNMEKRFLFSGIAILVSVALGAVIMTAATETSPTKAPEPTTQSEVVPEAETPKKKSCLCCADRIERLKKRYDRRANVNGQLNE